MQRPRNRNGNGNSYFSGKSLMHILSADLRLQISKKADLRDEAKKISLGTLIINNN